MASWAAFLIAPRNSYTPSSSRRRSGETNTNNHLELPRLSIDHLGLYKSKSSPRPDRVLSTAEEDAENRKLRAGAGRTGTGWRFEDGEEEKEDGDGDDDTKEGRTADGWSPVTTSSASPASASSSSSSSAARRPPILRSKRSLSNLVGGGVSSHPHSTRFACVALMGLVLLALSLSSLHTHLRAHEPVSRPSLVEGDLPSLSSSSMNPKDATSAFSPACTPHDWSSGRWVPRSPPLPLNSTIWTSSPSFHNHGCAQNWHRGDWYLGLVPPGAEGEGVQYQLGREGEWPMSGYRRRAAEWVWQAGEGEGQGEGVCEREVESPWDREGRADEEEDEGTVRLLQDLIDRGGWLILGDSLSEGHFMSLSCLLYPHVRALWPYPPMSEWHQIKEEHLLLDKESPLVQEGRVLVPEGWDWDGRPLVSHVRTDHGLAPIELIEVYDDLRSSASSSSPTNASSRFSELTSPSALSYRSSLLTDVETFSPTLDYMLSLFLRPSSSRNVTTEISPSYSASTTPAFALDRERRATESARYRVLIFSTGAHFSARHFNLPPPSSAATSAGEPHIQLFDLVVATILDRVAAALDSATEEEKKDKEVIVRPTSNGHDKCHDAKGPLKELDYGRSSLYSWSDMWEMNNRAEALVQKLSHPQISWVDIVRPAALRPDAHTNDDCLHLSMGTGVVEGWTRYIAYWLREKARAGDLVNPAGGWRGKWSGCLVSKTWQRIAEPYAWTDVVLDVEHEADTLAITYLDPNPVGGAATGGRFLKLIKRLRLHAKNALIESDEEAEDGGDVFGDDVDEASADARERDRRAPILHGPANNETSALPIVDSLARIVAECPNLTFLFIDQHLESVSTKVTTEHDPPAIWPLLTRLIFNWRASMIDLLPVLARLSRLQHLKELYLLLVTSDEDKDCRGTMTQELLDQYTVQPLDNLEFFEVRSFAEAPIGHKAVLSLLSPRAPLREVIWGGYQTPGLCKQLSYGTSEIQELTFTWMLPTYNLTNQLLPQLLELGRRPVKRLTFDIGPAHDIPRTQFMPPITSILNNPPYGVRVSRATDMGGLEQMLGIHKSFAAGDHAQLAAIKARPTVPVTFDKNSEWSGSLVDKPLLQVGLFFVDKETDNDQGLLFFGRFGDPDVEGDVTEGMLLSILPEEAEIMEEVQGEDGGEGGEDA
ncbi:hypothetical protein JCM10908_003659 [Rhodotorula pacifica]|uniref:uncharacterized protein n=1 Tax=Rhodotorula pacifica TaxID=1495444 RepID=UPI00316F52EA